MSLLGARVLVVEDEAIVCMMIEDFLSDMGCKVAATASSLDEALTKSRTIEIDTAILDINLAGKLSYPVASVLLKRQVPFLFATGYGVAGVPSELQGVPVLAKPFSIGQLEVMLLRALAAK